MPAAPPPAAARLGPRPLQLHLAMAATTWLSSLAALPSARPVSPASPPALAWDQKLAPRAAALLADLAAGGPDQAAAALGRAALGRFDEMLAGIRAYWDHPYRRALDDPPAIWEEGSTRLLDYGATAPWGRDGVPVLAVPSLVNRAYVLDLSPRRSLLRFLAGRGLRPLLVDWGTPGEAERRFSMDDYIVGRLGTALDQATALAGGPVAVLGYCMGGNLVMGLAAHRAEAISRLALLATPWDFHAERPEQAKLLGESGRALENVMRAFGELPVDILQAFFLNLDPNLGGRKFRAFARLAPESEEAEDFVALEDWLNDGVPLAAPVARQCFGDWYAENLPGRGGWRVGGRAVVAEEIELPALVVVPESDRIVPPLSARALGAALPGAEILVPPSGHIGMVVGRRAREGLWQPLAEWLLA